MKSISGGYKKVFFTFDWKPFFQSLNIFSFILEALSADVDLPVLQNFEKAQTLIVPTCHFAVAITNAVLPRAVSTCDAPMIFQTGQVGPLIQQRSHCLF